MFVPLQLARLSAKGGDDEAEDVLGALHEVCQFAWSASAKFCVLVCDAPGHGTDLHDPSIRDRLPAGLAGHTVKSVMEELRWKDIELLVCHLRPSATMQMDRVLRQHYDSVEVNGVKKTMAKHLVLCDDMAPDSGAKTPGSHFVFVLDDSGSMAGSRYSAMCDAYASFIRVRGNSCVRMRPRPALWGCSNLFAPSTPGPLCVSRMLLDHNCRTASLHVVQGRRFLLWKTTLSRCVMLVCAIWWVVAHLHRMVRRAGLNALPAQVVMFNNTARVLHDRKKISKVPLSLDFQSGETDFGLALALALKQVQEFPWSHFDDAHSKRMFAI